MNKPFKQVAPAVALTPSPDVGAAVPHSPGTSNANKRAETAGVSGSPAEAPATFPCRHCNGSGETEIMGLTDDRWRYAVCGTCEGTRVEAPYCGCCGSKLTCDLFCTSCDEYESLVYVERIAPGRIAC